MLLFQLDCTLPGHSTKTNPISSRERSDEAFALFLRNEATLKLPNKYASRSQ